MNTTLKYGLIGGAIFTALLSFYFLELYKSPLASRLWTGLQLFSLIIILLLGIKEKKSRSNNEINYRDAVFTGLSINFIIALTQSIAFYVLFNLWNVGLVAFRSFKIKQGTEDMKHVGLKADVIAKNLMDFQNDLTPYNLAKSNFMYFLLLGLIITLVISFFQRNKMDHTPTFKKI